MKYYKTILNVHFFCFVLKHKHYKKKSFYEEVYNYDRIDTNFFTIELIFVYYFKIQYLPIPTLKDFI